MSKVLIVTHNARFVVQFELRSIALLQSMGYEVHCATNLSNDPMISDAAGILHEHGVMLHQIDVDRSPYNMIDNIRAYRQLKNVLRKECYDAVLCHTPMGGVLGRLAANATKTRPVLYTAHGFHFYKGCPLKNRLIYESAERLLARYTDAQITINAEDYAAAKTFHLRGKAYYVPGVGVDVHAASDNEKMKHRLAKRTELDIPANALVFISVGELNENKNHETALKAFAKAQMSNSYYLICGEGERRSRLQKLSAELGLCDRVKLLGFRKDVKELLEAADVYVFPSFREGLSVALMEAMAAGLPCIASKIRGNVDLLPNSTLLFDPHDTGELCMCIKKVESEQLRKDESGNNLRNVMCFSTEEVQKKMCTLYTELLPSNENPSLAEKQ